MQDVQADEEEYKKTQAAERAKLAKMKKVQENVDKAREQNARRKMDKVRCALCHDVPNAIPTSLPRSKAVSGTRESLRVIGSSPRSLRTKRTKMARRSLPSPLVFAVLSVEVDAAEAEAEAVVGTLSRLRLRRRRQQLCQPRPTRPHPLRLLMRVHEEGYPCTTHISACCISRLLMLTIAML